MRPVNLFAIFCLGIGACSSGDSQNSTTNQGGSTPGIVVNNVTKVAVANIPEPAQTAAADALGTNVAQPDAPMAYSHKQTTPVPQKAKVVEEAPAPPAKPPAEFARCTACHSLEAGQNKIGPSLAGVFGRKAGIASGYKYSPAMQASGLEWDRAALDAFLAAPAAKVPGTKMAIGLSDPNARQEIIDYLAALD